MASAAPEYEVLLTEGAQRDLESICDYIAAFDSPAKADYVLERLLETLQSLSIFPQRGSYPKELLALGIKEYRQTAFKPYRMIYRVSGNQVIVALIADGRRNMQTLLARRLLSA